MRYLTFGAVAVVMAASTAQAGVIENACLTSNRDAANRNLCGCIQEAANLTLTKGDQKLAASFFRDPHKAQVVRQSANRGHAAFWERYQNFGATAQAFCK
ncbi:hypothetical protein [Actibacterium sp. MT2.3-13A]|uniref:hypothetical protein n=1 Tax=Actibacterium sp. MT2.3-13A TaxID=2828332 RepID=UPI001BA52D74|nr:hypothetical protein [Actibacterium sp. MT2.3-13A]